jgi:hypothetical protein
MQRATEHPLFPFPYDLLYALAGQEKEKTGEK